MPKHTYEDRSGFMLLDEGDYIVEVTGVEIGFSKAGNEMLTLSCSVEPHGTTVYERLVFTDKALWKVDQVLKGLGVAPEKGTDLDMTEEWCKKNLYWARGWVHLVKEEYEPGKFSNKIAYWDTTKRVEKPTNEKGF